MRSSPWLVRALMRGSSLVLLWLLVPSVASEAAASGRSAPRVCKPQTILTLHKLARVVRSISGPVAHRVGALDLDGAQHLDHGTRPIFGDDDAAIQNDAPAAWVDADVRLALGLEPLGFLRRFGVRQPKARDLSPRSPRGPPNVA